MYNFTQEDLLQYMYDETSPEKTASIKNALLETWTLREKMEVLLSAYKQVDEVKLLSPRKQSVAAILDYSEKTATVLSEHP